MKDEIKRIIENLRSTYDLATNEYAEKKSRKQMTKILVEELGSALKEIEAILEDETTGSQMEP